jgi:dipeptidyl aminopeptidase/acylaminoacyl peptidase
MREWHFALSVTAMKNKTLLLALLCAAFLTAGQGPSQKLTLSVDEIMRGPGLYGYEPRAMRWSGDGGQVYFEWKRCTDAPEKDWDTYVVNRDGSGLRLLSEEEARLAPPADGNFSRDRKMVVYVYHGDIFLYDRTAGVRRRLTNTADVESNPRFTKDEQHVAFVRSGNLYTLSLLDGALVEWTDIQPAGSPPAPGTEKKGTDSQEFIKKEERALLEAVDRRAKLREEEEAKRKKENPRKPWILAARQTIATLMLAPNEEFVIASVTEAPENAKQSIVPNYVTESAYADTIASRTMVGDLQDRSRLAIVNAKSGEVTWVDPALKEKDANGKEIDRTINFHGTRWSEDGTRLMALARSADNKDRWIFAIDPVKGSTRAIAHDHDEAWVNFSGTFGFLGDNATVYFLSERDGWSHLYTAPFDGGEPRQLTIGKWELESATLSKDKSTFWLETSEASLHERQIYSMPVNGGTRTRLTSEPGWNVDASPSPAEDMLALVHSYTNRPPELFLTENKPGAAMKRVTSSPAPEFINYPWTDAPIVQVPARDGAQIPAHIYKPDGFAKGGPAVIFVHGAGYLQNVVRGWSPYPREYMFHHLLMERGYMVIDLDYRASAGYGRDWRTAIYRHMGGKDLDDQVDAARWLVREHGVDPKRIGIYGGSYGGFITLMAMFTQPDVFAAGAALRPVTDWAHYNNPYTSDILNLPQSDPEAYKRSSPIYFAAGLKGALLICHGMVDGNVHFQDSVRLAQKLIELRKENWELAPYPAEDHGFIQPSSWADEYKRILKLFESNLKPSGSAATPATRRR